MTNDNAREHAELVGHDECIGLDESVTCEQCKEQISKYEAKEMPFAFGPDDFINLPLCKQCYNRIVHWGY